MASRKQVDPPKIHEAFDTKKVETVVNTNLATSIPATGTVYAGEYLQHQVSYRLDSVGRRVIISPENLKGVVF